MAFWYIGQIKNEKMRLHQQTFLKLRDIVGILQNQDVLVETLSKMQQL